MVVETTGSRTYVGRYDIQDEHGLHMLDVGVYDEDPSNSPGVSKAEYITKSAKFGIRPDHKHLIVPSSDIARVTRLGDLL